MRGTRALLALLAAGASLLALAQPAAAADTQITLTLDHRWLAAEAGGWTPYVATVRNDGAADFAGDIQLSPISSNRGLPTGAWPDYRGRITVPHGAERSLTFYVLEAPAGYQASLYDAAGHQLVSDVNGSGTGADAYAVGVLSDQPQAAQRIEALRPLEDVSGYSGGVSGMHVSRFPSAQAFPTNAVFLAGLHAVVIDDFDVSTLSDAQVRALHDFVGLGGNLVVAGGSAWRRTLLPLADHDLGGLRPQRTEQLPLRPLADLVGRTTDLAVAAGVGDLKGARVVLGAPAGAPLAVESDLGAGHILDLAFDPLDQAFAADDTNLAQLAWSFTLDRALLAASAAGNRGIQAVIGFQKGPVGAGAAAAALNPEEVLGILQDTPAAQTPPVGLLGGLLVFYVLLAGPVNYVVLKSAGRRELMWLTIPAIALLFTATAYVWGAAVHGATYFDSEVQVLRIAPGGAIEAHGYHGVFSPRRGDFGVALPPTTLGTTVLSGVQSSQTAVIETGTRTQIQLKNTSYGNMRTVQTLSVSHAPAVPQVGVEAHLKLAQGRVQGTVRNAGDRSLSSLVLVSGTGQVASLAVELPPRATANVDAPFVQAGSTTVPTAQAQAPGAVSKRDSVLRVATGQALTGRAGDLAVVGITTSTPELSINGGPPVGSGLAAVVQPVAFESADVLAGIVARPQLVVSTHSAPFHGDVFDVALPAGYSGPVRLSFAAVISSPTGAASSGIRSVAVYDWQSGTWEPVVPPRGNGGASAASAPLPAGAAAGGLVRLRVEETGTPQGLTSLVGLAEK